MDERPTNKVTVQTLIDPGTLEQIDHIAMEEGLSRSAVIRRLVLKGLEDQ